MTKHITDTELDEILGRNPLQEVEDAIGSYRDNPALTLAHALGVNALKAEACRNAGDLPFGANLEEVLCMYADLGFELVHKIDFKSETGNEALYYLMHPMGVLAEVETYGKFDVNQHSIYFEAIECGDAWRLPMSVAPVGERRQDGTSRFAGHMHMNEAPRHKFKKLTSTATIVKDDFSDTMKPYLLDFVSWKLPKEDRNRLCAERFAKAPECIQKFLVKTPNTLC
jgi:hypothetical protein